MVSVVKDKFLLYKQFDNYRDVIKMSIVPLAAHFLRIH